MSTSRTWRFCRDRRGVSAVEFAMIAPIAATIMLGAFDLGNAAQQQIALQEAVRTGGQYAIHFPTNPTGVKSAVTSALPTGWTLTNPGGVPVVTCSCNVNGTTTPYSDCSTPPANCTSPMLAIITATKAYTAIEPLVAAAIPSLTATYAVRFQ
jgi:Flp pilus assembly protein TadG